MPSLRIDNWFVEQLNQKINVYQNVVVAHLKLRVVRGQPFYPQKLEMALSEAPAQKAYILIPHSSQLFSQSSSQAILDKRT